MFIILVARRDYSKIENVNCGAQNEVSVSVTDVLIENIQDEVRFS